MIDQSTSTEFIVPVEGRTAQLTGLGHGGYEVELVREGGCPGELGGGVGSVISVIEPNPFGILPPVDGSNHGVFTDPEQQAVAREGGLNL